MFLDKYITKKENLTKAEDQLHSLKNEIASAKAFIAKIETGDLDATYPGLNDVDIEAESLSGALVSMRNQLKLLNKNEEQRKWITEGLNDFMVLLRQQLGVEETARLIISKIVKYIGANQGGIYIANIEEEILELQAFYAYDRQKFLKQNFAFGEGLIGQVYLEKQTQLIKRVPENYIRITSGLGDAPPSSIAIVPLKINEEVSGILELASFNDFEDYQIEFLEKLGENIASSVATLKNNERTQSLLSMSQEQADVMRAQEEEMMQHMEEMQTTQEELARKEAESQSVLDALNASYYVAELATNGNIISVNHLLGDLLKKAFQVDKIEELSYFTLKNAVADEVKRLLENVANGQSISSTSLFKVNEIDVWLSETFSPIYDANQKVKQILMIASDVTNDKMQHKELEKSAEEIKAVRDKEKARADHSIEAQTKMMERYIQQAKAKEHTLKTKIKQLEAQISQID